MDDNFSSRVKDVISYSKEEALRLGHKQIGTEHLLLGMLRDGAGKAISILNSIEVNLDELRKKIELLNPAIIDSSSIGLNEKKNLHLTRQAERALKTTFLEAKLVRMILLNIQHQQHFQMKRMILKSPLKILFHKNRNQNQAPTQKLQY